MGLCCATRKEFESIEAKSKIFTEFLGSVEVSDVLSYKQKTVAYFGSDAIENISTSPFICATMMDHSLSVFSILLMFALVFIVWSDDIAHESRLTDQASLCSTHLILTYLDLVVAISIDGRKQNISILQLCCFP